MAMVNAAVVLLLTPLVSAELGLERTIGMPMFQYKRDCGKKSYLKIIKEKKAALLQQKNVPGAGITPFEPFETVLKDGFLEVDCVKDYMYYRGDKFGDNKYDYKLEPTSNVSIVHYEDYVAKEDRVQMTQKVCFEFCRTVPYMGFFGIVNGRGCYCTPFFTPMASDSSMCDAVCEGENTLMCGGKSKSSIFSMHMCASTGEDLKQLYGSGSELVGSMMGKIKTASDDAKQMQTYSAALQAAVGQMGDGACSDLAQSGKVFAGEIEAQVKATQTVVDELKSLGEKATQLGAGDMTDPATVTEAERTMEAIEESMAAGETEEAKLDDLLELVHYEKPYPNASAQYYPVMYFIDKEYVGVPTTCGGETVKKPMAGSKDACASACDDAIHSCVAFQYFGKDGGSGCILFSKLESVFYYTGCGALFLQQKRRAPTFEAACMAKLSKFEGTTLKVDKSGKTDFGMKKITKADRCY